MKAISLENINLLLFDLVKGRQVKKYLSLFLESQHWSKQKIKEYQKEQLRHLIIHAYENVEFYKDQFKKNKLDPYKMIFPDDMEKIPPLTREDIQNNLDRMISRKHFTRNVYRGSSSGSTGKPVVYYHDVSASSSGRAAGYFGWMLTGWQFGDKGLHIWGNPSAVNVQWKKLSSRIKSRIFNVDKYPAFTISEGGKFDEISRMLVHNNYEYVDGYTNAIFLLAKHINDNNIQVPKVKRVLTTGENLHDYQRIEIEKALGPVFDCYGCGEINGIAYENRFEKGYAVLDTNVYVQYDNDFQGEEGERPLLITHLHNYVMPLIKYKNGDMGLPSEKKCRELPFANITSISGRISDIIQLPNGGNLVVPSFFGSKLLRLIKGIKQYQIIRTKTDEIEIFLAVDNKLSVQDEKILFDSLNEYLSGKINFLVRYTDKIKVSPNGKYKLLIDTTKL